MEEEAMKDAIRQLLDLDPNVHWFCPYEDANDSTAYFDEDVLAQAGKASADSDPDDADGKLSLQKRRITAKSRFKKRQANFLTAINIMGYDSEASDVLKTALKNGIEAQLTGCPICVRHYYRLLGEKRIELQHQIFDDTVLEEFFLRINIFNNDRISQALDDGTNRLRRLEPVQRKIKNLDQNILFGFLEAMASPAYSQNESKLSQHFDEPFELLGGVKSLKPDNYLPALGAFLFSGKPLRRQWAEKNWKRLQRSPIKAEWENAIREPLTIALRRVALSDLDQPFLPTFWNGLNIISSHSSDQLMTDAIPGLENVSNVFMLPLNHMHLDLEPDCFADLLSTLVHILEKAPKTYWDAMGTISPTTVIENIFDSPNFRRLLHGNDVGALAPIHMVLIPFQNSLSPDKQALASRTWASNLIRLHQDHEIPTLLREALFNMALETINSSMVSLIHATNFETSDANSKAIAVDPICVTEMTAVFDKWALEIIMSARGLTNQTMVQTPISLSVIENAVDLDISRVFQAFKSIIKSQMPPAHLFEASTYVWKHLLKAAQLGGAYALSTHVLLGCRRLLMCGKLPEKAGVRPSDLQKRYNASYSLAINHIKEILELMSTWNQHELNSMFKSAHLANGLIATLFFPAEVRVITSEILKNMTDGESRRDAIRNMIDTAYHSSIGAIGNVVNGIQKSGVFDSNAGMVRICTDVVDALFNSHDGLLRSKEIGIAECEATERLWSYIWAALDGVFRRTEDWSKRGYSKSELEEFCRDSIQLAETLYDYLEILVDAVIVEDADDAERTKITNRLLMDPNKTLSSMVVWLRLADPFLISSVVSIFNKIVKKHRAETLQIPADVREFVTTVCSTDPKKMIKTKLNNNQIASLEETLEIERPPQLLDIVKSSKARQGSLKGWMGTAEVSVASDRKPSVKKVDLHAKLRESQPTKKPSISLKPSIPSKSDTKKAAEVALIRNQRAAEKEADRLKKEAARKAREAKIAELMPQSKSEIYVDVDSEDEEESEGEVDMDEALRGIKGAGVVIKRDPYALQMIKEKPRGPLKIKRMVRTAKDMRARLAPDLSSLHQIILAWDYFYDGDVPPGTDSSIYKDVLSAYENPLEYKHIMEPLLLLEAWQGFVKAREENSFQSFQIKVANRASVNAFIEISTVMAATEKREVGEGDIVLLSMADNPIANPNVPHCLVRVHKVSRKKKELEIVYRAVQGTPLSREIRPDLPLWGVKIHSLTPLEREYGTLVSLQHYDLSEYILSGKPSHLLQYGDAALTPIMRNYSLNKAQSKAVKSAIDNDAFTLIQGPPGSGKTKTIIAIVGALLTEVLTRPQGMAKVGDEAPKKILVCAPSNAAVDELVMRFKEGVKTVTGLDKKINVIRIGRSDAVNSAVKDVTLEELVSARLSKNAGGPDRTQTQELMMKHKEVSEKLNKAREAMQQDDTAANKQAFDALRRQKTTLGGQVDALKDSEQQAFRAVEAERKRVQQEVINSAHILCATLSGSGHEMFQHVNIDFETVVVDEAAQCVEASALIPLKYGCSKCILVGDPKQLPPTVLSKEASRYAYEKSLFVRMQENSPKDVHLLDTQYRMHSEISRFPSATFYDGLLLDGPGMDEIRKRPWHSNPLLGPYRFFDVKGQHQAAPKGHSLINIAEIEVAMQLYNRLVTDFDHHYDLSGKVGIITPYKSQLAELKRRFSAHYGDRILSAVEFNTTDAFQGRESEVIIFSCVRASPAGSIGFLQDIRRMNVGLTRAKSSLWVLGNSESLLRGEFWKKLIVDAQKRGSFSTGNFSGELRRSTPSAAAQNYMQNGIKAQLRAPNASSSTPGQKAIDVPRHPKQAPTGPRADASHRGSRDSNSKQVPTGPRADSARRDSRDSLQKQVVSGQHVDLSRRESRGNLSPIDIEMTDAPPLSQQPSTLRRASTTAQAPITNLPGISAPSNAALPTTDPRQQPGQATIPPPSGPAQPAAKPKVRIKRKPAAVNPFLPKAKKPKPS
ncbi:hypothetical protein BT63DRAFT_439947 [Microthyrium microscopicum]|uniref:UvrD-like helicase ATP-binding domain-containing protein n=1 Tax=Microthyrium microscopicum TaxID=703497 RepID=A0A6A6UBB1_9PEZI|nr:hypothetical protein BT63DRAFT_439947 [Microthyrium microscopicum]